MVCNRKHTYHRENCDCLNPYSTGIWSATIGKLAERLGWKGLNPYSTGIWSATQCHKVDLAIRELCLNPYSTGIWSATAGCSIFCNCGSQVLILILLEYGLQPADGHGLTSGWPQVLILILLEYGLQPGIEMHVHGGGGVLILILLEYGLQPLKSQTIDFQTLKT